VAELVSGDEDRDPGARDDEQAVMAAGGGQPEQGRPGCRPGGRDRRAGRRVLAGPADMGPGRRLGAGDEAVGQDRVLQAQDSGGPGRDRRAGEIPAAWPGRRTWSQTWPAAAWPRSRNGPGGQTA
jgi:hypothetical protein